MELKIVSRQSKDYGLVKKLYKQAFPANERAPFWLLMRKAKAGKADFWALYDKEKWVGISYVVTYKNLAYIFYLAICAEERSKGYGEKAIYLLKDRYYGKKIFLALESLENTADNYAQRIRRHEFYLKCGLIDIPYKLKEASVIYDLMGFGGTVEPEEYREMIENYLGHFLSRLIDMRIIK